MAASRSGMCATGTMDGKVDVIDKTMEVVTLSEDGDSMNSFGTGGKGKDKEGEMDVAKSLLFETLNRLPEEEQKYFVDLIKRKDIKGRKDLKAVIMQELNKQGEQFDPDEDVSDVFGLDKDSLTNIPVPSDFLLVVILGMVRVKVL